MLPRCILFMLGILAAVSAIPVCGAAAAGPAQVFVIPVQGEIAEPELYIIRRGLKEATSAGADAVVFDLKTPGGAIDVTLQIMEAIGKFHGLTIAYVDNEAASAGAFVSASCDEIWFAPDGVIGAAAPVTSTGQDVDATMKAKLVSFLKARIRAASEGRGYRGQVVGAMIDEDQTLTVDGQVLKDKGSLLSLTAEEAMKTYGHPPQPLLGAGIAPDLDRLLARKFGARAYEIKRYEVTWSERLSVFLNEISPVLLGLGLLLLFVSFKLGHFGGIGIAGIAILAIVFFGDSVAGLSGHEPLIAFGLGALLVLLEVIFFHSAGILGVLGGALMLGSILWSMADLWPNEPISVAWSADAFTRPIVNLGLGLGIAVALAASLLKFLPRGWVWDRLIIGATVGGEAQSSGSAPGSVGLADLIGRRAVAATALRPAGQVEIDGRRFEATVEVGTVDAGAAVVVRGRTDFGLIVERSGS
jgi:membrane-bound serine protease (ClpP class)